MKAYRKPREFGWWSGLALLGALMLFGFSGYLLPMDELSYFATKVGLQIPSMIPGVSGLVSDLMRGGDSSGRSHRAALLCVARRDSAAAVPSAAGIPSLPGPEARQRRPARRSRQARTAERRSIPFFPNFFAMDLAMWLIALERGHDPGDAVSLGPGKARQTRLSPAPIGIHPEWYFMSQFQLLKVVGRWIPGYAGEITGMALFSAVHRSFSPLIPLFDAGSANGRQRAV